MALSLYYNHRSSSEKPGFTPPMFLNSDGVTYLLLKNLIFEQLSLCIVFVIDFIRLQYGPCAIQTYHVYARYCFIRHPWTRWVVFRTSLAVAQVASTVAAVTVTAFELPWRFHNGCKANDTQKSLWAQEIPDLALVLLRNKIIYPLTTSPSIIVFNCVPFS